ncbi:hypothetical protein JCM8547_000297 [Rhodosporidiobolus lusitaniae]
MFRATAVRSARVSSMKFPNRAQKPTLHSAQPHPCAPQSAIDSFSRFQNSQQNPRAQLSQQSSYGGPAQPPHSSSGSSGSSGVSGGKGSIVVSEEELPAWLRRTRRELDEAEIEAVNTGGATATTPITPDYKLKWYTAQI